MRPWIFGFLTATAVLQGQTNALIDFNPHGWFVYNGDHQVAGRWGIHFDGQWRRSSVINEWQQLLLRPGINYDVNPNFTLSAGYAYVRTYRYGDFPAIGTFPEHRLYQQAVLRHSKAPVAFQQRFRLEQRFVRYPTTPDQSVTYQNRFRYLARADVRLTSEQLLGQRNGRVYEFNNTLSIWFNSRMPLSKVRRR